ncbi:NAD(P)-dependent oxidoreductase [Dactylosporangium sp. NPDC000244]|uniref:NAD-dependent epimerase/dehydratase family protein n=1 Tax=Dactylosporangium sp. NPDC000244 TaxID=3154365 RepID=UPI00331D3BC0|nr:NAD(P)-dependent oxidoreductase [Dactylosporangium thailandense]
MSRVLVTGGSGMIGAATALALAAAGYNVTTLDMTATGPLPAHVRCDVRDLHGLLDALKDVDDVVHCGGLASDRTGHEDETFSVNVAGTCTLLQAAVQAGIRRVVYMSSINALGCVGPGRPEYLPVDDDHPHRPVSAYQMSKHLSEEACRQYAHQHGLTVISLRPCYVIQPGAKDGTRPAGPGRTDLFAYIDLRDVTSAVNAALAADLEGFHAFLLAAPDPWDGAGTIRAAAEFPDIPRRGANPSLVDCGRAHALLGWAARFSPA